MKASVSLSIRRRSISGGLTVGAKTSRTIDSGRAILERKTAMAERKKRNKGRESRFHSNNHRSQGGLFVDKDQHAETGNGINSESQRTISRKYKNLDR